MFYCGKTSYRFGGKLEKVLANTLMGQTRRDGGDLARVDFYWGETSRMKTLDLSCN